MHNDNFAPSPQKKKIPSFASPVLLLRFYDYECVSGFSATEKDIISFHDHTRLDMNELKILVNLLVKLKNIFSIFVQNLIRMCLDILQFKSTTIDCKLAFIIVYS